MGILIKDTLHDQINRRELFNLKIGDCVLCQFTLTRGQHISLSPSETELVSRNEENTQLVFKVKDEREGRYIYINRMNTKHVGDFVMSTAIIKFYKK